MMKPLSNAERQKRRIEKLKKEGKFEEFKRKKAEERKRSRQKKKENMNDNDKENARRKKRIEMQKYRLKKKHQVAQGTPLTEESPYLSKSTETKATQRVSKALPRSPRKQRAVLKNLVVALFPHQSVFKKQRTKKPSILTEDVKATVKHFYCSDVISTQAPGIRDRHILRDENGRKVVGDDGKSKSIQKRYLCYTFNEAYKMFCIDYPYIKLGRTSFHSCKPDHVMLRSETPANSCLCIYHENLRLLVISISCFPQLKEFISSIVCDTTKRECMLQTCTICKDLKLWHEIKRDKAEDDDQSLMSYYQWQINEENSRLTKMRLQGTLTNILDLITSKLEYFLYHDYVKYYQSLSFKQRKENLNEDSIILHFDFSKNYEFISQDEIQSAHWEHQSCTLFTAMVHYKDNEIKHDSYVVVSDYLNHDKYVVVVMLNEILNDFKLKHTNLKVENTVLRSDGTSQHFKQRFTLNWMTTIPGSAAWEFSATSHGKGDIDGIGGTCKRRVREKTMARLVDPKNSLEFSQVSAEVCPKINIIHIAKENIITQKDQLDKSWSSIMSIPGTRKAHYFQKVQTNILSTQMITNDPVDKKIFDLTTGKTVSNDTDQINSISIDYTNDDSRPEQVTISELNLRQGEWIEVIYEGQHHIGLIEDIANGKYRVRCLCKEEGDKWWKLESDGNVVWYEDSHVVGCPSKEPKMHRRGGLYIY